MFFAMKMSLFYDLFYDFLLNIPIETNKIHNNYIKTKKVETVIWMKK